MQPTEETPAVSPQPNLRELSRALRALPPDFEWDFSIVGCDTHGCALGLARRLWSPRLSHDAMQQALGLTAAQYYHIFVFYDTYKVVDYSDVTPLMVADKIDHFLATGAV